MKTIEFGSKQYGIEFEIGEDGLEVWVYEGNESKSYLLRAKEKDELLKFLLLED